MEQQNGNTQLNSERANFNSRVQLKKFLGNTTRIHLNKKRRYRSI